MEKEESGEGRKPGQAQGSGKGSGIGDGIGRREKEEASEEVGWKREKRGGQIKYR